MLSITNLHAGYGKVEVLHGISLEVPKGQVVTLIGTNGAGKTTTMRAISGMIAPREGKVMLGDVDITGRESHRIARLGLAHSPEGRRVFATMTRQRQPAAGRVPALHRRAQEGRHRRRRRARDGVLPAPEGAPAQLAGTLSGGEQQMLAMARAMMMNPEVVLLDEPSMGLAPILVDEVFRIISRLRAEGVTMLLVEQFAAAALNVSDYGYVLENGRIAVHGPADKLKNDPAVQAAYLGGGH